MLDQNKRRTLKMLSVTPLVTPLVSMPVLASKIDLGVFDTSDHDTNSPDLIPTTNQAAGRPLQIQILDTAAVPDNNVLVRNDSDETLLISRFMPGHIYFNGQIMDLNEAIGNTPLILQAGQSKAFQFNIWPVLNAGPVEYVWADHAVEILSADTSVITLGAFMVDNNAIVYVNTQQTVAS